eukprot:TRINITY_DN26721_c0_g2_i1.p1 TRINITY_DN26721_c0_g2~~TRINITY_DN26721_c0_g2_i1.p1  ORF type:complete len:590 (+),score=61.25 TRINITY_DN26721_c0_g2_i1:48-1772(+)
MAATVASDIRASLRGRYDIRFRDPEQENKYWRSSHLPISKSLLITAVIVIIMYVIIILREFFVVFYDADDPFDPFLFRIDDKQFLIFWIDTIVYLAAPIVAIFYAMFIRRGICFQGDNIEMFSVISITVWTVFIPWSDGWSYWLFDDNISDEIWLNHERAADGTVVLAIDFLTTAVCLFVPMRMVVKWIPPTFGCISYLLAGILSSRPFDYRINHFGLLAALSSCALLGAWGNEVSSRERFIYKSEVVSKQIQLERQHASLSSILDCLCDSLVHLRSTLDISGSTSRLRALLMLPEHKQLDNENFCDFISCDEDREKFISALQASPSASENESNGMVNVHLRDFTGREFLTYAYHASYCDSSGECHYVIGLVEAQERQVHAPLVDSMGAINDSILSQQNLAIDEVPAFARSERFKRSDIVVFSSMLLGVVIELDATTFEVLESLNLSEVFDSIKGQDFSLLCEDTNQLRAWLSSVHEDEPSDALDVNNFGPLSITLHGRKGSRKCKLKCKVSCAVILQYHSSGGDSVDSIREIQLQVSFVHSVTFVKPVGSGTSANSEWESLSSCSGRSGLLAL